MPIQQPEATTFTDVCDTERRVKRLFPDADCQLRGLFFPAGDNHPHLVTVPFREGALYLHYWLFDAQRVTYLMSRPEVRVVGIRRYTFKSFPTTTNFFFDRAYTIYYWTQEASMHVNRALATCCHEAAPHLFLRGDAIVLKHRQSGLHRFEDVTAEDVNLICAVLGCGVSKGLLDFAVEEDYFVHHIDLE